MGNHWSPQHRNREPSRIKIISVVSLILIIILAPIVIWILQRIGFPSNDMSVNPHTPSSFQNPITTVNGESIGISDGTFAFDTDRPDGTLKIEAAKKLKAHNTVDAIFNWKQALALGQESNDAEALIYLEDQRVLASGNSYITIVVGTVLTGKFIDVGRLSLQGVYVAQKEYNDNCKLRGCVQVRLLIANSGSGNPSIDEVGYASFIIQQIVLAAQSDKTIVGMIGWPLSSSLSYVNTALGSARIPIVSPSAAIDSSTSTTSYLFHVAPPNNLQGIVGAEYAEQTLHVSQVALFVDPIDPYSDTLASAFRQRFTEDGNMIVATEDYSTGKPDTLLSGIHDALKRNPQLIYFAGHIQDVGPILTNLPSCRPSICLLVLGGDALYESGRPPNIVNFSRLRFTVFAYPDEWEALNLSSQKPIFFSEYPSDFDPLGKPTASPYGYVRPNNNTILSYDAMLTLLQGCNNAFNNTKNITSSDLEKALKKITGNSVIQGASGQISFGADNNPIDKPVIVVCVDQNDFTHVEEVHGQFLKGGSIETLVHLNDACV